MPHVVVSTDGYRSATGDVGWAFIARADNEIARRHGRLADAPSHLAEWVAVSEALAWAEATLQPGDTLELRTDSALVEKGLARRRPEMHGEAGERRAQARQALARLAARGIRATVTRVGRHENAEADAEARHASGPEGAAGAP